MSSEDPNPPWYVTSPDGELRLLEIPERLSRHPELQQRGIIPVDVLKPGTTYSASGPIVGARYVIKILRLDNEERAIYERLLCAPKRPNDHTAPAELTSTGHPLLIMPMLGHVDNVYPGVWTPRAFADVIFQLVQGLEYLHSLRIAHLDVCPLNVMGPLNSRDLSTFGPDAPLHRRVVKNRVYFIDYDASKQFSLGPGVQHAITLPPTVFKPPHGLKRFDPYSWDVYCLGCTLEWLVESKYSRDDLQPPWWAERYIKWLVGNERGCTSVCHCRPSARTALRVVVILRWAVCATEGYRWVVDTVSRLLSKPHRA